jgi:ABC-type lipoprotein release transport system permease subunit
VEEMRVDDVFRLSLSSWRQKKVRVSLLMLAIAIGVASIIALVSQTAGAQQAVARQLLALGPTSIVVTPIGRTQLTDSDVGLISTLPNVETVIPMIPQQGWTGRRGLAHRRGPR